MSKSTVTMARSRFDGPRRRTASQSAEDAARESGGAEGVDGAVEADEVLRLLSDEYARTIIAEISEESLPARSLVERVDASRATVYRRLSSLEDAGLVESGITIDTDGHHRQEFSLALDTVELTLEDSGVCLAETT